MAEAVATPTPLYSVDIPQSGEFCLVRHGNNAQTFMTTKAELAAALQRDPTATTPAAGAGTWIDTLATHGIAMKQNGAMTSYLILAPAVPRRIFYQRPQGGDPAKLDVTFPPILFGFRFNGNHLDTDYAHTKCYLVDPAAVGRLKVSDATPCLHYYPYGNVFTTGGICWGGTDLRRLKPTEPVDVTFAFFESPFNNHLFDQVTHPDPRGTTLTGGNRPNVANMPNLVAAYDGGVIKWPGRYPTSVAEIARL